MDCQYSKIYGPTKTANFRNVIFDHYISISYWCSIFPVCMLWTTEKSVTPFRLAWFIAKIFFRFFKSFEWFINLFPTKKTIYYLTRSGPFILASSRAKKSKPLLQPRWLGVKTFAAYPAVTHWHIKKLSNQLPIVKNFLMIF